MIPDDEEGIWAVFGYKSTREDMRALPVVLRAKFHIVDGNVDLAEIAGGDSIPIGDLESRLRENSGGDTFRGVW